MDNIGGLHHHTGTDLTNYHMSLPLPPVCTVTRAITIAKGHIFLFYSSYSALVNTAEVLIICSFL